MIKSAAIGTGVVSVSTGYFAGTLIGLNLPLVIAIGIYLFVTFLFVASGMFSKQGANQLPQESYTFSRRSACFFFIFFHPSLIVDLGYIFK